MLPPKSAASVNQVTFKKACPVTFTVATHTSVAFSPKPPTAPPARPGTPLESSSGTAVSEAPRKNVGCVSQGKKLRGMQGAESSPAAALTEQAETCPLLPSCRGAPINTVCLDGQNVPSPPDAKAWPNRA